MELTVTYLKSQRVEGHGWNLRQRPEPHEADIRKAWESSRQSSFQASL